MTIPQMNVTIHILTRGAPTPQGIELYMYSGLQLLETKSAKYLSTQRAAVVGWPAVVGQPSANHRFLLGSCSDLTLWSVHRLSHEAFEVRQLRLSRSECTLA